MPYGIAKSVGGDSAENVAQMKRCIEALRAKGTKKLSAILICKSQLQKGKQ